MTTSWAAAQCRYREVEGGESDRFARLFPQGLRYLAGGTASGFKHVDDAAEREPVLLRIKGLAGNVAMRQVKLSRTVMNSGDCYVMDTPQCIYQWNGKESSAHERAKASELCRLLQQDKHRDTKVLDEGTPEGDGTSPECSNHGFWRHLPGERRFFRMSIQDESAGERWRRQGIRAASAQRPTETRHTFASCGGARHRPPRALTARA